MENHDLIVLGIMIGGFALALTAEVLAGRMQRAHRAARDGWFTLAAFFTQPILTSVIVASIGAWLLQLLLPAHRDAYAALPFLPVFLGVFLLNEFCHYWVHRWAHEKRWLWKLHRTHHSGMDMNVGLVYRYNLLWPMIIPQTWIGVAVMYFGQTPAFLTAAMITYLVNVGTHVSFRWDLALRQRFPATEPLWRVIEKVMTLPDAHQAHHAYGSDHAHPNGNYAVTLFIYDVLFGTAKLPHARQVKFGLPISPRLHWAEELLWPFVRRPLLPKPNHGKPASTPGQPAA